MSRLCTFALTPERTCTEAAEVLLEGEPLCANHLHTLYPNEVESGHAAEIPGVAFID